MNAPQLPMGFERRQNKLVDSSTQRRVLVQTGKSVSLHLGVFLGLFVLIAPAAALLYEDWLKSGRSPWSSPGFVLLTVAVPVVCTFLGVYAHALLHAGRIVGPCYRFRRVSEDLEQLRVPRGLRIRRDDHLQDTAEALDRGLVALHDAVREVQEQGQQVERSLAARENSLDPAVAVAFVEDWHELQRRIARFQLLTFAPQCQEIFLDQDSTGPAIVEPLMTECQA